MIGTSLDYCPNCGNNFHKECSNCGYPHNFSDLTIRNLIAKLEKKNWNLFSHNINNIIYVKNEWSCKIDFANKEISFDRFE